jgi:hypothetical protein
MTAKRQPVTYPAARKPLNIQGEVRPTAEVEPAAPSGAMATDAASVAPSRQGKRAVTFYLPQKQWLALRTTSLRLGRPTHELMAEATEWLLSRYPEDAAE